MKTVDYIAASRVKAGIRRNTQLAKMLNLSDTALSRYENGERVMDDYTAARLAEILGINPMTIIAQANAERERDERKRAFWLSFAQKARHAACIIALPFVTNFLTPDTANATATSPSDDGILHRINYTK